MLARTLSNGNGATTTFPVSFPFENRAEVAVYVYSAGSSGSPGAPLAAGSAFTWVSDGQIHISPAPANGKVVDVRRTTKDNALDNVLQPGGSLRSADLVQNDVQLLYLIQEREDFDTDQQAQINTEVARAKAAETANTNLINAETTRAEAAEAANAGLISAETAARIDAVGNEATARVVADAAEAAARAAGDAAEATARAVAINGAVSTEAAARVIGDASLQSNITAMLALVSSAGAAGHITAMDAVLTPEQFGAVGEGITNDTSAFQALAATINAAGGGVIWLRPGATYLVGRQSLVNAGGWMWKGETILTITGCARPVILMGNGAKFKLADNLKVGTFDAAGNATAHSLPYFGGDLSAPTPEGIITFKTNTGKVILRDFEIDGREATQNWGGPFGDTGWQVPGDCLFINNNTGGEDVENVYAHHSVRDSCVLFGGGSPTTTNSPITAGTFKGCRFEYSCRQGLSFVGGRGYKFDSCHFNYSGKGSHFSSPGAGVDLEAESGLIRDLHFEDCEFVANIGNGMNADSGDIRRAKFTRCVFIGTDAWAVWVVKPYFTFDDCLIAGGITLNPTRTMGDYGGAPNSALPRFTNCRITDDLAFSPTGTLFGSVINSGVNLIETLFDRCSIRMCYNHIPQCTGGEFRDCSLDIGSMVGSFLNPKLTGRTVITAGARVGFLDNTNGRVGGVYSGAISYNGAEVRSGSAVYDPPSLAAGARTTTPVTVPWARLGLEDISVTFSLGLQGLKANAWVTTPGSGIADATGIQATMGVVTVALENPTAGAIDLASGTLTVTVRDRDR